MKILATTAWILILLQLAWQNDAQQPEQKNTFLKPSTTKSATFKISLINPEEQQKSSPYSLQLSVNKDQLDSPFFLGLNGLSTIEKNRQAKKKNQYAH
ncbi:MAG: hypothetical protein R3B45_03755 [Bdellovibrionota bacterium]